MIEVEAPDGTIVEFPDGTSRDVMRSAMAKRFGGQQAPTQQEAPKPEGGGWGDVLKSAGIGVAQGAIGLAGLPGDVRNLMGAGWNALTGQNVQPLDPGLPTSGGIKSAVEGVTGEFYKPQTTAGKYARTAGEFAPGLMMGPGGLARRAITTGAASVGSEAAGQATEGTSAEPWARIAGAIGGGMVPSALRRAVTPLPTSAENRRLAGVLDAEGVPMTAGQRTGSQKLQYLEAEAMSRGAGPSTEATQRAFTQAALRRTGDVSGEIATPDNMARISQRLGNTFRDLANRNTVVADQQLRTDLIDTATRYAQNVLPSQRTGGTRDIQEIIGDIATEFTRNNDQLAGTAYQSIRSRLTKQVQAARQNDPQLADALRDVRNALDDAMSRSIHPDDAAAWARVRRQYGNYKDIEKAAGGAGADTARGMISPSQLRTSVSTGKNKGRYVRGEGDLSELARAGEALLKPLPQSGTAPRMFAQALMNPLTLGATVGGATMNPLAAAGGLAAGYGIPRALMSRPVQGYLGNQAMLPPNTNPAVERLIQALLGSTQGRQSLPSR